MTKRATILRQRLSKSSVFFGTWWVTGNGDTVCVDSRRRIIAANCGSRSETWNAGTKLREWVR